MQRNLAVKGGLLAGFCVFALAALAAGRGGIARGEAGGQRFESGAHEGSGSFRPSGGETFHAAPHPSFEGGRAPISRPVEPSHESVPRPEPFQRPQAVQRPEPVQRPEVIQRPPAVIQRPGSASLPSFAPSVSHPGRAEEREEHRGGGDFLGMQSEHAERSGVAPNRATSAIPGVPNRLFAPGSITRSGSAMVGPLPNPPGRPPRPAHPPLAAHWQDVSNQYHAAFDHWHQAVAGNIAAFEGNRAELWNRTQVHAHDPNWARQFRTAGYRQWQRNVSDFRKDRAAEIWSQTKDLHNNLFDEHWWSTCWWRRSPLGVYNSPWWWWNGATWADQCAFFGDTVSADPIAFDPGDNVVFDGDNCVINGQDAGSADAMRDDALAIAGPQVDDVPVPDPPTEGQPAAWISLGAWALTQQEQGDPVMFFQISADRNGIVAGGYKNALTGEEQPIVGRIDRARQRVAWHINSVPQTVFETGLSNLSYDVTSVFIHFGQMQTQTWLMVRLPSPETPPGPVTAPPPPQ